MMNRRKCLPLPPPNRTDQFHILNKVMGWRLSFPQSMNTKETEGSMHKSASATAVDIHESSWTEDPPESRPIFQSSSAVILIDSRN